MGKKLVAMPWKAFEFSNTENTLILNADKKKLEAAPGFAKHAKWPHCAHRTWFEGIYKCYGYEPYWKL